MLGQECVQLLLPFWGRQRRQVAGAQRVIRSQTLHRAQAIDLGETQPQAVMALNQRPGGLTQRQHIQRTSQPQPRRHVVGRVLAFQMRQEPQALLRVGHDHRLVVGLNRDDSGRHFAALLLRQPLACCTNTGRSNTVCSAMSMPKLSRIRDTNCVASNE